ncbi:MAG: hypothetical protein KKD44_21285 [Proteobacteria bacterium]|nr:hypothetical protein [Pseudomonadota bacterium]
MVRTSYTDENDKITRYEVNKIGETVRETCSDGGVTLYKWNMEYAVPVRIVFSDDSYKSFGYDSSGNLIEIRNPNGAKIIRRYNEYGEKVSEAQNDAPTLYYFYSTHGNLIRIETDDGQVVATYNNDHRGNVLKSVFWDGTQKEYRYDSLGRIIYKKEGDAKVTYSYDALGVQL